MSQTASARLSDIHSFEFDSSFVIRHSDFLLGGEMSGDLINALLTAGAMGIACAVLSVFVVLRRWAFVGEGISHSAMGGAGCAWLIALAWPAMDVPWFIAVCVVAFCIATAIAISYLTRLDRLSSDAVIGIFLVASLAFGFLAQGLYLHTTGNAPIGMTNLFFGEMKALSSAETAAALCICGVVLLVMFALFKEILAYCFDPAMAEVSGVRAGFVHYLLMVLLTVTILVGMRVMGSILVIAMLVLPGATALLLSRRLNAVLALAIGVALAGVVGGILINTWRRYLPLGPAIVLVLFVEFLCAFISSRLRSSPRQAAS
jgi:ABC-type Mn2+/Zn2+ transport system permease subunit